LTGCWIFATPRGWIRSRRIRRVEQANGHRDSRRGVGWRRAGAAGACGPSQGLTWFRENLLHVDMDAFFVSVEELFDPSLKASLLWWAGRPTSAGWWRRASYAARKFGVTRVAIADRLQAVPAGHLSRGSSQPLSRILPQGAGVLREFSPVVEMASIDEAYLDMTGTERLHGPPLRAAHSLHNRMKAATGLNCSIGISASRMSLRSPPIRPNQMARFGSSPAPRPRFWLRSTSARSGCGAK